MGHDDSEIAIADYRVSQETVTSGVRGAKVSVTFMRDCIRSVKPCRDPMLALKQAGIFSGALAASVLRGREPDLRLVEEWRRTRRRFRIILPVSLSIAVGTLMTSILVNDLLVVLLALSILLMPWIYRPYWFLKEEMIWFGL
jgi:hypothetical protein